MRLNQLPSTPVPIGRLQTPQPGAPTPDQAAQPAPDQVQLSQQPPVNPTGSDGKNLLRLGVWGLATLATFVPAVWAGSAGGALVGGTVGGALGPVAGALSGNGVFSSLSSAWAAGSATAQAGLVIGAATGAVGSVAFGRMLGNGVGRLTGLPKDSEVPKSIDWSNKANVALGLTVMTTGIAGGILGGLALGGGAGAAATVIQGVFQEGFRASALTGVAANALTAGAVGAATAGTVCALGAAEVTKGLARHVVQGGLGDKAAELVGKGGQLIGKGGDLIGKTGKSSSSRSFSDIFGKHSLALTTTAVSAAAALCGTYGIGHAGFVQGTGIAMSVLHGGTGFGQLITLETSEMPGHKPSVIAGEALTCAGLAAIANGVGPIGLGMAGLGLAVRLYGYTKD